MNFREFENFYNKSKKYDILNDFIQGLSWDTWMGDFLRKNGENELDRFVSSLFMSIKGDVDALANYSGMSKNSFKNYYEFDLTDLKTDFEKTREYKYLVYIVFNENNRFDISTQGIYFGKIDKSRLNSLF